MTGYFAQVRRAGFDIGVSAGKLTRAMVAETVPPHQTIEPLDCTVSGDRDGRKPADCMFGLIAAQLRPALQSLVLQVAQCAVELIPCDMEFHLAVVKIRSDLRSCESPRAA